MSYRPPSFGLPCAFHSEEIITNFCKSPECLLPLCPKCIRLHNSNHKNQKTFSNVDSIDLSLKEARDYFSSKRKIFVKAGEELSQIQHEKQKRVQQIKQSLKESRERLLNQVNRTMDRIEKTILSEIQGFAESVYFQLKNIDERIRAAIAKSLRFEDELNGPKCLNYLIQYHTAINDDKDQVEYEWVQEKIREQIQRDVLLTTESSQLQQVKTVINKFLKLQKNANPGAISQRRSET